MSKNINKGSDQRRKDDCDGQGYLDLINGEVKVVFNEKKYPYTEGLVHEYYDSLLTILQEAGVTKKLIGFSTKIGNIIDSVYKNCGDYSQSLVVTDLPFIDKDARVAINNLLGRYINAYLYDDFKPEDLEELLMQVCRVYTTRPDDFRLGDMLSSVKNSMGGRYNTGLIVLNNVRHKDSISPIRGQTTLTQFLNRVYDGMKIFSLNKNNTVREYLRQSHTFEYRGYVRYWHKLESIEQAYAVLNKRIEEARTNTAKSFSNVLSLAQQLGLGQSGRTPEEIINSLIDDKIRRDFWRKKIKEDKKKFAYCSHSQATSPALSIEEIDNMFKNRKNKRRCSGNSP